MIKKKLKQTNASGGAHLIQYRFKMREGSSEGIRRLLRKGFVKEISFKSGVKDRGSDRWREQSLPPSTGSRGGLAVMVDASPTSHM